MPEASASIGLRPRSKTELVMHARLSTGDKGRHVRGRLLVKINAISRILLIADRADREGGERAQVRRRGGDDVVAAHAHPRQAGTDAAARSAAEVAPPGGQGAVEHKFQAIKHVGRGGRPENKSGRGIPGHRDATCSLRQSPSSSSGGIAPSANKLERSLACTASPRKSGLVTWKIFCKVRRSDEWERSVELANGRPFTLG